MIEIDLRLEGDGAFDDWRDREILHAGNDGAPIRIALLEGGMTSGKPSVIFGFDLRQFDGQSGDVLAVETSAALFVAAARAIVARHPELWPR